jgi:hypothetical protein
VLRHTSYRRISHRWRWEEIIVLQCKDEDVTWELVPVAGPKKKIIRKLSDYHFNNKDTAP